MKKLAKIWNYGNPMAGQSWFDDETPVKIVKDPDTGEDWVSPFFAGVNSVVSPDGSSTSPAHQTLVNKHMSGISEFASNSLSSDKEALKAYLARYAKTLREYKEKHGKYPRQRVIGHSRGGGGALEFMEALAREHPELPRIDEYIGLDPYDTPFAPDKNVRMKDKRYVAKRSIIVRPKRPGALFTDASDMDGDGKISLRERIYPHLSNLLVQFAKRMNPFSRRTSTGIAVPGVHHSSATEMLDAAMAVRKAKSRRNLRKILKDMYGSYDPAYIESENSPLYGDSSEPVYEKVAASQEFKTGLSAGLGAAVLQALLYPISKSNMRDMSIMGGGSGEEISDFEKRYKRRYLASTVLSSLILGASTAAVNHYGKSKPGGSNA